MSFLGKLKSNKSIVIKYDKCNFITNLKKTDLTDAINDKINAFYNEKGILVINASDDFFVNGISQCPQIKNELTNDTYFDGIIKRMFSQIEFEFFKEGEINHNDIRICDNIFKSIYTKSVSIKRDNITQSIEKYNEMQKGGYINKKIIDGIIYSVYDFYNSLHK